MKYGKFPTQCAPHDVHTVMGSPHCNPKLELCTDSAGTTGNIYSSAPLRDRTNLTTPQAAPADTVVLQRSRGLRDAGFWQKVTSPGGSKSYKRRRTSSQCCSEQERDGMAVSLSRHYEASQGIDAPSKENMYNEEVFTDDWRSVLDWKEGCVHFQSSTLPRNHKCTPVRMSLPGHLQMAPLQFGSPFACNMKSPYNFIKARLANSPRFTSSPGKTLHKFLKVDISGSHLPNYLTSRARGRPIICPLHSNASTGHHSGSRECCYCATNCRLLSGVASPCTLPRPGLTQRPPTPPSPRRHGSWWTRLSATTRELQAISTLRSALVGYLPPDAELHGPDVVIDWGEGVGAGDKKWSRKNSLPRHLQRARRDHLQQDAGGASDNEARGSGDSSEHSPSEGGAGDRVQGWAASFERLIEDPAGLHTFAVFLKKEYSYENISFWAACERYRQGIDCETATATDTSTKNTAANITNNNNSCSSSSSWSQWAGRHAAATAIYNTHLGNNASEPVNVDSQARSLAQEGLRQPTQDLFALAQKQVYNLMKFDSYSRFLKSPQYQECLEREARGEGLLYDGGDTLDASLRIHPPLPHNPTAGAAATAGGSNSNFGKGKSEMEERRRRSLLPWHRSKDRSKSKDRLADAPSSRPATGGKRVLTGPSVSDSSTAAANRDSNSIGKAKSLSVSAGRLGRAISGSGEMHPRSNSATRSAGSRHPSDSSGSLGRASEVSGSKTSLNSGSDGVLLMGGRKALSKESLTSSECLSLSGGEGGSSSAGGSSGVSGRCRVVLPDRSQSVVAVRSGVSIERVMRRLLDRRGLPFLAFSVLQGKSEKPVALGEDSSVLCSGEVRLQQLVLFRLDLPNQKTVCVKAKPHKTASDVLRPILAKYGFKLDLMHIHTVDDPRPINVKGPITELDGQKFIIQTKEDVKEWGVSVLGNGSGNSGGPPGGAVGGSHTSADALDAITNRVFEDLLHSKTSHQLFNSCDYDARSTKTDQGSEHSGGVRAALGRHSALADKCARLRGDADLRGGRAAPAMTPAKDNDDLYEGLKRAQMSRIEDQRGTEINSELPDFLKCDSEGDKNLVDMVNEEVLAKCFPEGLPFLSSDAALPSYCGGQQTALTDQQPQQHFYPNHHHHHCQTSSQQQQPQLTGAARLGVAEEHQQQHHHLPHTTVPSGISHHHHQQPQQPQQHSSSSLAQHQTLHNFWSDISGGGSSMPSSLLATSSSSLSSSTGLPMSSSHPFDVVDIPLTVAKSLLDMQYNIPDQSRVAARLRPRPESCVTTQTEMMATRQEQANRPKSSCGALTVNNSSHSSPNRTLLASPDLDATLLPSCVLDGHEDRRRTDAGAYGGSGTSAAAAAVEEVCRVMRMQSPTRHTTQQQQHMHHYHHHRHQHHHLHLHQSSMDALMPESLTSSSNMNASMTTGNSDFNINGMLDARSNNSKYPSAAAYGQRATNFSTPPPPLPPKPKLGVPPRGPPPRPPSRQLQLAPLPAHTAAQCPPSSGTNYYTVGLHAASDGGEAGKKERGGEATKLTSANDQDAISFV